MALAQQSWTPEKNYRGIAYSHTTTYHGTMDDVIERCRVVLVERECGRFWS
jgi:hypothetical protein